MQGKPYNSLNDALSQPRSDNVIAFSRRARRNRHMDARAYGKEFDAYFERPEKDKGVRLIRSMVSRVSAAMPRCSRSSRPACLSSSRITTRSPCTDGSVETRTSTNLPPIRNEIRPSCGTRFSAMSSRAITLIRETTRVANVRGDSSISFSTPSKASAMSLAAQPCASASSATWVCHRPCYAC